MNRHDLIVSHIDLVERTVGGMSRGWPAWVDRDDARSVGLVGLIHAADRYKPELDVPFQPYAIQRIRGAVLDWQRNEDWVPRRVRAESAGGVAVQHVVHMDGDPLFTIVDPTALDPEGSAVSADSAVRLRRAVRGLRDRERVIVEGIYFEGRTLISLGAELGMHATRVWQIRNDALRHLRSSPGVARCVD